MNAIPAAKLKMMRDSLNSLLFGLLALVPIIGVVFGLVSLCSAYSASRSERRFWNPGKPYRVIGLTFAIIGLLVWSFVDTIWIYKKINPEP